MGVRRAKAALSSGCKSHPANAPAGSRRSSYGGDEIAEAFVGMRSSTVVMRTRPLPSPSPVLGFFTLTQSGHRPPRYGRSTRLETRPSSPTLQAARIIGRDENAVGPSRE